MEFKDKLSKRFDVEFLGKLTDIYQLGYIRMLTSTLLWIKLDIAKPS
jgi:hypothetical protein